MRVLQCDNCRAEIGDDDNRYILQDLKAINIGSNWSDEGVIDLCMQCAAHIIRMTTEGGKETYAPNVCPPHDLDGSCNWVDRYGNEWAFQDGQWSTTIKAKRHQQIV